MNNTTNNIIFKYAIIIGLGLISFIPLYIASPLFFPFISGKGFVFRILVEVIFALWIILIFREKGKDTSILPRMNAMTITVTVFTVITLIANIFGLNPLRSIWSNFERMEGWIIIVHLWMYFMVLSSVVNTKENWKKFFDVILIAGFITAVYGLFQFFGWAETHQGGRVDASLGNSAYMAIYMLINAFIAAYMAIAYCSKKNHYFYIYTVLSAFFSFIMFQTATRGSILGWILAAITSLAIYAIMGRKETGQSNKSRIVAGSIIGAIVLVGVLFYYNREAKWIQNNSVLGRIATISISDTKTQARGFIWPMAIKGVFGSTKTAIIGIGQENFNYIFNANYNPKMWAHEQWFDRAHSVFLDWLVAGGILGLLAYLALYIVSVIYILKSDQTVGQKSVLIGLLVGYGIHNVFVFDNQTSYVMFYTFLAFVFTLQPSTKCKIFKKHDDIATEDYVTIQNYVITPIVIIIFASMLYIVNIKPIQANTRLISGLRACSKPPTVTIDSFVKALDLNLSVSNQEIREQLLNCASGVIRQAGIPEKTKIDFYNLAKKGIEDQIKETPNDARIYILGGGFFDSISDYASATPLLEKANQLSPNKQTIVYQLASNYLNTKRDKEAILLMENAYKSAPDNNNAKIFYISTLITTGNEATALKLFPNDPSFYDQNIIRAYVGIKRYAKAAEIYNKLIKDTPDSQELYSGLAYVYLLDKQNTKAIEVLNIARNKFPLMKTQIDKLIIDIQNGTVKI